MPLKVIIVEDNPTTVRSLKETIDWASLGCQVAGVAYDGATGRKRILEASPDIVLTDIRMPQMDGLDMIEAIRQNLPDCKIIIITGYDQFQYASRAIKLSVFDYLLKPIDNGDLTRVILRAAEAIRGKREADVALKQTISLRRRALLFSLLTNDSQRGQGVCDMFLDMGLDFTSYYIMVLQLQEERVYSQAAMRHIDGVLDRLGLRAVTVLLYDAVVIFAMRDDEATAWRAQAGEVIDILASELPSPFNAGISKLATSRHAIRQAYHQARQALWETALNKHIRCAHFYRDGPERKAGEGMGEVHRRIDELIEKADLGPESAARAAQVIAEQSGGQYCNLRAMVSLYAMALRKKYPCPSGDKLEEAMHGTLFVSTREEAQACLERVADALRQGQEAKDKAHLSLLIRNALQYIRLHAIEGLSLQLVAEKLCVSANYLSALVRKETGVTFHEHVLAAKMDVARTMLADPRILVEDVAHAVGYGNYISFYNAFKRSQRMTPTEYRNRRVEV
ncbi:MAG: response regulator [Candidatus Limiplasma sp.]|nr:response regulator [Candidatus Limiplasma sp.]